ncbi:NADH-quinone oxidoreductase subunit C [Methanoregula sp.]|jgi:ech hydrogenase subunit D|uniref:NADH-quinone oxidoreductase subunit C n=1 Tax=Methanoregula sp. TaxID=2052170 RepID=UPI003C2643CB
MAKDQQTTIPVSIDELVARTAQMKKEGFRLVQIGCTKIGDDFEINYVFDKDYVMTNLRITVKQDTMIPSVSSVYFGAFVYENEIHDLYGITVSGINIDFGGKFYRTTIKQPFSVTVTKEDTSCQNK